MSSLCHKEPSDGEWKSNELPPIGPEAFIGTAGRFADTFLEYAARPVLLLGFLTSAGAIFGRATWTLLRGERVYGNLYSLIVNGEPPVRLLQECIAPFEPQFVSGGVYKREALLFLVRDALVRSERMTTEPNTMPTFVRAQVDQGVTERRILITQADIVAVVSGKTAASLGLRSALVDASRGRGLSVYMDYRSGGYLESATPHVSILASCPRSHLGKCPPNFAATCLFVLGERPPSLPFGEVPSYPAAVEDIQAQLVDAMLEPGRECPLEPVALAVMREAVQEWAADERTQEEVQLAKLGLLYARLAGRRSIGEKDALAAKTIVSHSRRARHNSESAARTARIYALTRRIEEGVAAHPAGLSKTQVSDLLGRNCPADVIDAAIAELLAGGRVRYEWVATRGRDRQVFIPCTE